jgi:hypothetical protein
LEHEFHQGQRGVAVLLGILNPIPVVPDLQDEAFHDASYVGCSVASIMVLGGSAIAMKSTVLHVHSFSFMVSLEDGSNFETIALD